MADAVSTQVVFQGERELIMKFTNVSDGTGEAAVTKVDVSTLTGSAAGKACNGVTIEKIHVSISVMKVNILWDATTDVPCFIAAPGVYTFDFTNLQMPNNSGTGKNGNVLFTTISAAAGATYTIVLQMVKTYAP